MTEICCLVIELKGDQDFKRAWEIPCRLFYILIWGCMYMYVCICQKSLWVTLWFFAVPYISLYINKLENIIFIFVENYTLQNNFWHYLNRYIPSYPFVINFHHALDILFGKGNMGKRNVCHFRAWTLRGIPSSLLSLPIWVHCSWITAFSWWKGLCNSMKLWTMPCRATQDEWVTVKSSDKMWSIGEEMTIHSSILAWKTSWTVG